MTAQERPNLTPELLASLLEALPARMKKRLDGAPTTAEGWTWSMQDAAISVATDGEEKVTLHPKESLIADLSQVQCTCLLSPKCFHAAAVLSVLPVALPGAAGGANEAPAAAPSTDIRVTESLSPSEIAVGEAAFAIGADVLAAGFAATSALRTATLLRVSFEARKLGVPAIEGALLRVFVALRQRANDDPDFRLSDATRDLAELLTLAQRLRRGDATAVGIARNVYHAYGSARLTGLCCEPILVGGQAGVVTHFSDGKRLFSAGDVMPGSAERAVAAYDAPLRFGEVSLPQRDACRQGLVFAAAKVAANGRLGAGKEVVVASTKADAAVRDALFAEPLANQLARAATAAGQGLVFLDGVFVENAAGRPVFVAHFGDATVTVGVRVAIDDPRFAFRENLSLLAKNVVQTRLIARLEPGTEATVVPLALVSGSTLKVSEGEQSDEGSQAPKLFPFDEEEKSIVNLAFDRVRHARFPRPAVDVDPATATASAPMLAAEAPTHGDPLMPLRRRLERYALAGRGSLPASAQEALRKDAAHLDGAFLRGGAALLTALFAAAGGHDRRAAAERFVAATAYLYAAEATFAKAAWLAELALKD
jgi:hypothetical protein